MGPIQAAQVVPSQSAYFVAWQLHRHSSCCKTLSFQNISGREIMIGYVTVGTNDLKNAGEFFALL